MSAHPVDPLASVIPPIDGDRSRLYLGARAAGTGRTHVTFHDFAPGGAEGPLAAPPLAPHAGAGGFDWGPARCYRAVCLLSAALLNDACGPLACQRLWREFARDVVGRLPDEDWELTAGRIQAWVTRRLPAPPPADLSEGGGA